MPQITTQTWRKWFYSNSYQEVQDHGGYSFGYLQHNMPTNVGQRDLEEEYKLSQISTNRNNGNVAADDVSIASSNNANVSYESTAKRRRKSIKKKTTDDAIILTELEAGPLPSTNTSATKPPPLLRLRYRLWLVLRYLQNYEFRFALKLSAAVGILTIPAWLPDYQLWFAAIRGQWAALTVSICIDIWLLSFSENNMLLRRLSLWWVPQGNIWLGNCQFILLIIAQIVVVLCQLDFGDWRLPSLVRSQLGLCWR